MKRGLSRVSSTQGFTLIELLIAMSLTVLTGAISYQFIDASLRAQAQGDAALTSLTAIEQTWQLMASDLHSSIDRPVVTPAVGADLLSVLDAGGTGQGRRPSMMSAQLGNLSLADLLGRDGALLWFTRHGWVNPLAQQRSELQRVLYRLDNNGSLFRDYWPERNQQISSAPEASLLLLENVQAIRMSFLPYGQFPDDRAWLADWPLPSAQLQTAGQGAGQGANQGAGQGTGQAVAPALNRFMPAAIRVSLQTPELGQVERIFLLAGF